MDEADLLRPKPNICSRFFTTLGQVNLKKYHAAIFFANFFRFSLILAVPIILRLFHAIRRY